MGRMRGMLFGGRSSRYLDVVAGAQGFVLARDNGMTQPGWFSQMLRWGVPVLYYVAAGLVYWQADWVLRNLLPNVAFGNPVWLWALLGLPVLWIFSWDSLAGLGATRSFLAIALRTSVCTLIILALAEAQYVQRSEKMTVIYVLDQSLSIPGDQRQAMLDYVVQEVKLHRNAERGDRAGIIVFGRDAKMEVPPFDSDIEGVGEIESYLDLAVDATNLASALKLAQATFPEDAARRVVIVSDGNENLGSAQAVTDAMIESGIGVDVVPVPIGSLAEVAVEKVTVPVDVRRGQPFDVRVVLHNLSRPDAPGGGIARGKLKLIRRSGERDETIEQQVEVPPGKKVFTITQDIENPSFYTYLAEFEPDRPGVDDAMTQNNRASAFVHVRGKGHILLIEDWENKGEFDFLVERLKAMNLEVTVQSSDRLFTNLAELQQYDTVILANVPRSSGGEAGVTNFSDAQIDMLVRNTQQMGAGLVMLGGPSSFGAGGWTNTELEKAMPVDFAIKNSKVIPVGALVMTMHASEMPDGNHWQKVIGVEAIKALGPQDYCGMVQLDGATGQDGWLWGKPQGMLKVGPARDQMVNRVGRMVPGDMPDFDPSMRMAAAAFVALPEAAIKHMIIISDGDPSPPRPGTVQALINAGAKVSTVAIGAHDVAGSNVLQQIATQTGGKYYVVTNPKALPRIYQREARRVAQPLIFERAEGFRPVVTFDHEMLRGIGNVNESLPVPLTGYVHTTKKDNPLVEVSLLSPVPGEPENSTILASWTYGLGRAVVFTSDGGKRWTNGWTSWEKYDKLFSQIVRWSMRPVNEDGKFSVATEAKGGKVRVVVTALDANDEFLNFIQFGTSVVGPDMKPFDVKVTQVAPGRYVGEFDASEAGSYFINLSPGAGKAPIRTGVNVPYSPEFLDRETNEALLKTLAAKRPVGGEAPGKMIEGTLQLGKTDPKLLAVDTFRHDLAKATSSQDIWPFLLVVLGAAFFADVLIRRVTMGFEWLLPIRQAILGSLLATRRESAAFGWLAAAVIWVWEVVERRTFIDEDASPGDERISRLKSRKAQVSEQLDERRAATRFEPEPDSPLVDPSILAGGSLAPPVARPGAPPPATLTPGQEDAESYTARLLKAKQQAKKQP